jgi:hypothetical protein
MKKIGIVIIATNAYFVLGIKLIKQFYHFYSGDSEIVFYFFSDTDPAPYLQDDIQFKFYEEHHESWVNGTNSKFINIISLENEDVDYLYYFDADTGISRNFTEEWFIGDLVGGEHFANRTWMIDKKGFDRNPKSKAYVPLDTNLPQMYYYGAFFGGKKDIVVDFCKTLRLWQLEDKKIPYEPGVNDESYINAYFHYNQPKVVTNDNFAFNISDKSGIGETRNTNLNIEEIKKDLLKNKNKSINICNGKVNEI